MLHVTMTDNQWHDSSGLKGAAQVEFGDKANKATLLTCCCCSECL